MSQPIPSDDCKRHKVIIDDENYYLIVGKTFVEITCPFENRPENYEKRRLLNILCGEISKVMEIQN
jgi:hypothetical protein